MPKFQSANFKTPLIFPLYIRMVINNYYLSYVGTDRGICGCDQSCTCLPGWSGMTCDCNLSTAPCVSPFGVSTSIIYYICTYISMFLLSISIVYVTGFVLHLHPMFQLYRNVTIPVINLYHQYSLMHGTVNNHW